MGGDFYFFNVEVYLPHIMENEFFPWYGFSTFFFVDHSGTLNLINVCCIFFFLAQILNDKKKKKKKKKKVIEGAARDTLLMRQSGVEDKLFTIARVRGLNACEGDVYPVIAASQ